MIASELYLPGWLTFALLVAFLGLLAWIQWVSPRLRHRRRVRDQNWREQYHPGEHWHWRDR